MTKVLDPGEMMLLSAGFYVLLQTMHGSLKEHLHSERCMVFIRAYKKCHEENKFGKFFGACNVAEEAMKRCCREERKMKMKLNRDSALKKSKKDPKE